jgi:hypothetical protein
MAEILNEVKQHLFAGLRLAACRLAEWYFYAGRHLAYLLKVDIFTSSLNFSSKNASFKKRADPVTGLDEIRNELSRFAYSNAECICFFIQN